MPKKKQPESKKHDDTNVMGLPVGRLYQELKRICPEKIEDLLKHTV